MSEDYSDEEDHGTFETFDREEDVEVGHEEHEIVLVNRILEHLLEYKKKLIESDTGKTEDVAILDSIERKLRQDSKQLKMWIESGKTDSIEDESLLLCVKGVEDEFGSVSSWPGGVSVRLRSKVEDFFETCPYVNTIEHLDILQKNRSSEVEAS